MVPGRHFLDDKLLKPSPLFRSVYDLCEEQNKRIACALTLHASANKLNDSESLEMFPSKSCPLRYGIKNIQEDALNIFHVELREYIGIYHVRAKESKQHEWSITGLSIPASKIDEIPYGKHSITKYFHSQHSVSTSTNESNDIGSYYGISRNLPIKFKDDSVDETPTLAQVRIRNQFHAGYVHPLTTRGSCVTAATGSPWKAVAKEVGTTFGADNSEGINLLVDVIPSQALFVYIVCIFVDGEGPISCSWLESCTSPSIMRLIGNKGYVNHIKQIRMAQIQQIRMTP